MALEDTIQNVCSDCVSFGTCEHVKNLMRVNNYLAECISINKDAFKTVFITLQCRKKHTRKKPAI